MHGGAYTARIWSGFGIYCSYGAYAKYVDAGSHCYEYVLLYIVKSVFKLLINSLFFLFRDLTEEFE